MRTIRTLAAALFVAAGLAIMIPTAASAQGLPPEAQEALDEVLAALPPEAQDAVGEVLAEALVALMEVDVDGVGQVDSNPGHSTATALEIEDLITVNKSETTKEGAKVTRLSVAGYDLFVKEDDGSNSGGVSLAGDLLDEVNTTLCPAGSGGNGNTCVTVLDADASSTESAAGTTNTASSSVANVETADGDGVSVLPNMATTTVTPLPFLGDRCTDLAMSSLLGGGGTTALLSIVGLKLDIGGILAPC